MFKNKTLLITGGTGSFGNQVVESFLNTDIRKIIIFSRDENKQEYMRKKYSSDKLDFHVGDVRDYLSISNSLVNVDYVFHAAALKQVPSCEFFPLEAVKTNILGTENVLNSAIERGVTKVICLSTDKAAYPVNSMGMSKALMEKIAVAKARNSGTTTICATRYGNVLASRGSVLPVFLDQIKRGVPCTITEPNMTRFVMTLKEAMDLVLFAFKHGENGDLFIQKSPSCTVMDLFDSLNKMHDDKLEYQVIGPRHGEKEYEVLMTKEEASRAIEYDDYYRIISDGRNLNYEQYISSGDAEIMQHQEYNSNNTSRISVTDLIKKINTIDIKIC